MENLITRPAQNKQNIKKPGFSEETWFLAGAVSGGPTSAHHLSWRLGVLAVY
jgi:hypothetical protein